MKRIYNLSTLSWTVSGFTPYIWRFLPPDQLNFTANVEIDPVPARVPGSVQAALRDAGVIPNWEEGLNARACEWVENRQWVYQTTLPDEWCAGALGKTIRLRCLGLDYAGWVFVNGKEVGAFTGSFVPHVFDLSDHLQEKDNRLAIVFDCPPRWLGQFGYTSQMKEWKPRFNYTWDWTSRLVQIGVWDAITVEITDGQEITAVRCWTDFDLDAGAGVLTLGGEARAEAGAVVLASLQAGDAILREETLPPLAFASGVTWRDLPVAPWWPNGEGDQPLYTLHVRLMDGAGAEIDGTTRRVGFKHVEWQPCAGAPPEADPWLCVVNGRPVFLQGVNWTPILPNFADVREEDYRVRLELYRRLGCNILRVWGGAVLEKTWFYDLCDELGLLVWQEFPLSSSGLDNWPPEDAQTLGEMEAIARSYVERRQHHVSLLIWCGGNELTAIPERGEDIGRPADLSHPLLKRFSEVVQEMDPTRRFLPTSPSGPRFMAREADFGKGLHWDVHGPWNATGEIDGEWTRYWQNLDALFISEAGAPGASPVDIIRQYKGDCDEMPASAENPLWRRTGWWIEWPIFAREHRREPASLEEYVAWSQERQARALKIAVGACKARFLRCGGVILWMGHDCFPCAANTAIVDLHGRPKPAAEALSEIWHAPTSTKGR